MQRTSELMPFPQGVMRFLSQNEEEKTWVCATCGVIKPFVLGNGYYARRPCACEQQELEQQRRQAVPRTLAEALTQAQIAQTYTWLGRKWAQQGLAYKTFATFERKRQERAFGEARAFVRLRREFLPSMAHMALARPTCWRSCQCTKCCPPTLLVCFSGDPLRCHPGSSGQ